MIRKIRIWLANRYFKKLPFEVWFKLSHCRHGAPLASSGSSCSECARGE